jgi:hypothetical protein
MELASSSAARLIDKFVKDGQSWSRARYGYEITLGPRPARSMMSNWIGGAFVNRDKKGDPGNRAPIEVVPVPPNAARRAQVRHRNTFRDEAFGLTPELLRRMTLDKWMDGSTGTSAFEDVRPGRSTTASWASRPRC